MPQKLGLGFVLSSPVPNCEGPVAPSCGAGKGHRDRGHPPTRRDHRTHVPESGHGAPIFLQRDPGHPPPSMVCFIPGFKVETRALHGTTSNRATSLVLVAFSPCNGSPPRSQIRDL